MDKKFHLAIEAMGAADGKDKPKNIEMVQTAGRRWNNPILSQKDKGSAAV